MTVAQLLNSKTNGATVVTVRPTDSITMLISKLSEQRIGALVVSADGMSLDGIISERDVIHGLAEHGCLALTMPVAKLMTRVVITCAPTDHIAEIAKLMTLRRVRHVPVREGTKLCGVISIGDVLKSRIDEMQLEASVLRDTALACTWSVNT